MDKYQTALKIIIDLARKGVTYQQFDLMASMFDVVREYPDGKLEYKFPPLGVTLFEDFIKEVFEKPECYAVLLLDKNKDLRPDLYFSSGAHGYFTAVLNEEVARAIVNDPEGAMDTAVFTMPEGLENLHKMAGKPLVGVMENGVLRIKPSE